MDSQPEMNGAHRIPTFDVAITSYRRPDMTAAAVRSALDQGRLVENVICVDDASRDDTVDRLSNINDHRLIIYERPTNGGIGSARQDALERSTADWTIQLDSDHELLPGAVEKLSRIAASLPPSVGVIGGRFQWDTGALTPVVLPGTVIDYRGRIEWSSKPHSIGTDYVACIARNVRGLVRWSQHRSVLADALFHLDLAKHTKAVFTSESLALQRSNGPEGSTRGSARHRLRRRKLDAAGGALLIFDTIIERHGDALRRWGPALLAGLTQAAAMYALLGGDRRRATALALDFAKLNGARPSTIALVATTLFGRRAFEAAYLLRG